MNENAFVIMSLIGNNDAETPVTKVIWESIFKGLSKMYTNKQYRPMLERTAKKNVVDYQMKAVGLTGFCSYTVNKRGNITSISVLRSNSAKHRFLNWQNSYAFEIPTNVLTH